MKRCLRFLLTMLLFALPLVAQTPGTTYGDSTMSPEMVQQMAAAANYVTTNNTVWINNVSNCAAHSCWHAIGGTGRVLAMSGGYDGFAIGIGTDHHRYQFRFAPAAGGGDAKWGAWPNGTVVYAVAVHDANQSFALTTNNCASGQPSNIIYWDGTKDNAISGCLNTLSISNDSVLLGVNQASGAMYLTSNPTVASPTWNTIFASGWSTVSIVDSVTAYGIRKGSTVLYKINLSNKTYAAVAGAPAVKSVTVAGNLLFVVTPTGVPQWTDITQTALTWKISPGALAGVYGNVAAQVFGIDGSNIPYHFLAVAQQTTTNIHGNFNCSAGFCPPGAVHTATVTGKYPNGYFPGTASAVGSPSTVLDATALDVAGGCDLMYDDMNDSNCAMTGATGQVRCTVMGTIITTVLVKVNIQVGWGLELVKNLSGPAGYNCYTSQPYGFSNIFTYNTAPSCSNLYPVYPLTQVRDSSPAKAGWWVVYECAKNLVVQECTALPAIKTSNPGPSSSCVNPY